MHEANIPLETWLIGHRVKVLRELLGVPEETLVQAGSFSVTDE